MTNNPHGERTLPQHRIMAAPLVKKFLAFKKKLKGVDHYKRLHIKMGTRYSLYQDTNKNVCVFCWRLRCKEEPSTHSCH